MATFGLIHGSWHGAWCWAAFVPELEARGHTALTVDLPIDTPTGPAEWARVAAGAFAGDQPSIVVGHSMAGIVAPLVADHIPVRGLIYLSALLRRPGRSCAADRADGLNADLNVPGFAADVVRDAEGYTRYPHAASAARDFYQDCEPSVAEWAFPRLRRQRGYWRDVSPQVRLPAVPAVSIVCAEDRAIAPDWQRRVARDWLGITPIDFPAGHSPFVSRPRELADLFHELAVTIFAE